MAGLRSNLFATKSIIPNKKQAEFKGFKKQTTIYNLFLENYPAFKALRLIRRRTCFPLYFQWLIKLKNATTYFGCISKDKYGNILSEKALEMGMNVQFQYTDKEPTGTCGVIITGENRSVYPLYLVQYWSLLN